MISFLGGYVTPSLVQVTVFDSSRYMTHARSLWWLIKADTSSSPPPLCGPHDRRRRKGKWRWLPEPEACHVMSKFVAASRDIIRHLYSRVSTSRGSLRSGGCLAPRPCKLKRCLNLRLLAQVKAD